MGGVITWEEILRLITIAGAIGGVWFALWRENRAIERRVEEIRAKCAHELAEFKTEVAKQYARNEAIKEVEERVVEAINRLADRLDRILDRGAVKPRGSA